MSSVGGFFNSRFQSQYYNNVPVCLLYLDCIDCIFLIKNKKQGTYTYTDFDPMQQFTYLTVYLRCHAQELAFAPLHHGYFQ